VPRHLVLIGPFQDRPTGELCVVIADNAAGLAVDPDKGAELPGNPCPGEAGVRHEAQAFARAIVDHGEDPELPRGTEAVGYKVQRSR